MSSNIRYDNPADGDHAWGSRRPALVEAIEEFDPAILATQEGREPQLRSLADSLKTLKLIDSHRHWIEERMYPCLFINPALVDVIDSGDLWLSETPEVAGSKSFESTFPRLITWVEGTFRANQRSFLAASVHLDHVKASTRAAQAKVIVEQLFPRLKKDQAFILMGDFNEPPGEEVREVLQENFEELYDPWFILDKAEESSHHNMKGEEKPGGRIDWILVNRLFDPFDIYLDKKQRHGVYPSDHYPVKAVLNLNR